MRFLNKKIFLIVGLLILAGAGAWWLCGANDAVRIHRNLDTILGIVSKQGDENPLVGAAGLAKLEEYIVPEPRIEVTGRSSLVTDRSRLIGEAGYLRSQMKRIEATVEERQLEIDDEGNKAVMRALGTARLVSRSDQSRIYSARYQMHWVKEEGKWLLQSTEVEEILLNGQPFQWEESVDGSE